jgi:hypothetical protein
MLCNVSPEEDAAMRELVLQWEVLKALARGERNPVMLTALRRFEEAWSRLTAIQVLKQAREAEVPKTAPAHGVSRGPAARHGGEDGMRRASAGQGNVRPGRFGIPKAAPGQLRRDVRRAAALPF